MSQAAPRWPRTSGTLSWSTAVNVGKWLGLLAASLAIPILACGTFTTPEPIDPGQSAGVEQGEPRAIPTSTPITIPTPSKETEESQTGQGLGGTAGPSNMGLTVASSNIPLVIGERASVIANAGINLREFSSTSSAEVWKLSQGEVVEVLQGPFTNEDLFWWRVKTLNDLYEGMVAEGKDGVNYLSPAANTLVPLDRNPIEDDIVRVSEALNMRRDPGLSSPVILTLEEGQELLVVDGPVHQGEYDWYELRNESGSLQGWSVSAIGGRRTLWPLE